MPDAGLTLVVADRRMLDAAIEGPVALSRALGGARIAEGWEVFPEALPATRDALERDPGSAAWGTRLFVLEDPPTLVGWGGFKGPPAEGVVEIGYSVAPAFRERGIAGDAVHQMLRDASASGEVRAVIAHTMPSAGPSTRVLEGAGFAFDGEEQDGDEGRVWRWRHEGPFPE